MTSVLSSGVRVTSVGELELDESVLESSFFFVWSSSDVSQEHIGYQILRYTGPRK